MKTKTDKKVNRIVKKMNKSIAADIFGNRFWIRQVQKIRGIDGMQYYSYELKDRQEPERDRLVRGWLWGDSQFFYKDLALEINDFIVSSDFWYKKAENVFNQIEETAKNAATNISNTIINDNIAR